MAIPETTVLDGGAHLQRFVSGGRALSWREVLDGWKGDVAFRRVYARAIADAPFDALFWECTSLDASSLDDPFEHVLVESGRLSTVAADAAAFAGKLAPPPIATFPNLGHDAVLVAPTRMADPSCYPHLATFLRGGPTGQVDALFEHVGRAVSVSSTSPLWVSTSGLGVYWVHVRLDSRPKYYTHEPFRRGPEAKP